MARPGEGDTPIDHTRMPIIDGMRWYHDHDFASFATPGHRLGAGIDPALLDLFEKRIWEVDMPVSGGATDVHLKHDVVLEAERLGADASGWNSP